MKSCYLLLSLLGLSTPAIANECDMRAADLVRLTNATLDRRETMKIFLKLQDISELAVECWPTLGVEVGLGLGLPPDAFFEFVGQAAYAVIRLPVGPIKQGAIRCHQKALRTGDELTEIDHGGAHFECTATLLPTPGKTSISVLLPR